jgi:hypothetical protein
MGDFYGSIIFINSNPYKSPCGGFRGRDRGENDV